MLVLGETKISMLMGLSLVWELFAMLWHCKTGENKLVLNLENTDECKQILDICASILVKL